MHAPLLQTIADRNNVALENMVLSSGSNEALQAAFGPDMPPSAAEAEVSARTAAAKEEAEAKKTKKKVAPVSLPHDEVRWLQPWPTPYCRIPATADRRRAAGLGR